MDRDTKRQYDRDYHARRSPEKKRRKVELQFKRKRDLISLLWVYKSEHPCLHCGESDPVVLEFHHTGPKLMEVAEMARRAFAWHKIQDEIDQCIVLCANCHRRVTARDFGWNRYLDE